MWLDRQVSLYSSHADNIGRPATFRDILFTEFAPDLPAIIELRKLNQSAADYKAKKSTLKSKLQCFTPAGLLASKAAGKVKELDRTGIMQLDFDGKDISQYDIEDLKQCVFELPFIGFCGLSCSGGGFYALALIGEPRKLADYAEHCFAVLESYGIKADATKGKKVQDLRYVSYDSNMLVRENAEILHITNFQTKQPPVNATIRTILPNQVMPRKAPCTDLRLNKIINRLLEKVATVSIGERHLTIGKVGKVLGGYQHLTDANLLQLFQNEISKNKLLDDKAIRFSKVAFDHGKLSPINLQSLPTCNH